MANRRGLAQSWQRSPLLPWLRLLGALVLALAGIWLVVAGPLFHRLWLDVVGAILLALGGYLVSVGTKGLRHTGS